HVLDLDGGFDRVWGERFHASARKAVRRAERAGLTVERDTTGRLVPAPITIRIRLLDKTR
ncbi:MAG: hypothetical protein ACM3KJ_09210, partial [Bacillota bacterium]